MKDLALGDLVEPHDLAAVKLDRDIRKGERGTVVAVEGRPSLLGIPFVQVAFPRETLPWMAQTAFRPVP